MTIDARTIVKNMNTDIAAMRELFAANMNSTDVDALISSICQALDSTSRAAAATVHCLAVYVEAVDHVANVDIPNDIYEAALILTEAERTCPDEDRRPRP